MLIWNLLFVILVVAPILTGGIWIKQPGLQLEYTQAGPAAVVLLAWLVLWLRRKQDYQKEVPWILRGIRNLWRLWTNRLENKPFSTLTYAWLIAASSWFLTSLLRHRAFGSGLADLGIFTNAISNVAREGYPFSSLKDGLSLLADHQNFLIYPLGWIFPLWPSPTFLLLLQALGLSSGAIALYLLCRQRVGASHPLLPWTPLAFWFCGPLRSAARFDFHPEVFMLPLFLFAAFLLQERARKHRALGFLLLLLAIAAKESAGPVACGLGLAWLLGSGPVSTRTFTRPLGLLVVVIGLGAFLIDSLLIPKLFATKYAYGDLYAPLGTSPLAIALSPFLQPGVFWSRILAWSRVKFFLGSLLPMGFLPLAAPTSFVAALPGFLMLFLTNGEHRISLGFHYSIEPMTGLLFALPAALDKSWVQSSAKKILPLFVLASLVSLGRSDVYYWRIYQATAHHVWVRDKLLPHIPEARSVAASYGLVPHLSTRRWVNQLPFFQDEKGSPVDCVLVDESVNNTPLGKAELNFSISSLQQSKYQLELQCGTLLMYARAGGASCLEGAKPICPETP